MVTWKRAVCRDIPHLLETDHQRLGQSCVSSGEATPGQSRHRQIPCETMRYSHFWNTGKQSSLAKDGITNECRSENHVPLIAPTRHQSTPADAGGDSLPDWLQPVTQGLVEEPLAIESAGRRLHATCRTRSFSSCTQTKC